MREDPAPLAASAPRELERLYLARLLAADPRGAREVVELALDEGVPAEAIYLEVVTLAMHEVGRLWEAAEASVAQEHLATQITQSVMIALALRLSPGEPIGRGRPAVVCSSPGERHALGGQMVADFLSAQGWEVLALGADVPAQELAGFTRHRGAQLVALSTAMPGHLLSVTRACQLLRQLPRPPFIVAGGRAYDGEPFRAAAVGADAFAADPQELLQLVREHFAGHAVH